MAGNPSVDLIWNSVDDAMPEKGRLVEMINDRGYLLTGHFDGVAWAFTHRCTSCPIEYWRYAYGRVN